MKAIILAAGKGTRLAGHTNNLPKCLLKIGGQCLIDHQIQALRSAGVHNIVMVLGYKAQDVRKHVEHYTDMHFTFLDNPEYPHTNTAYSLWIARAEIHEDFIYLNADVLFHAALLKRLIDSGGDNALAVTRKETGPEEVKVTLKGCRITSIGKDVSPELAYGEFIGAARFCGRIADLFSECLEQLAHSKTHRQDYFEAALQRMLPWIPMTAVDVGDLFCIEIDYPEDLTEARLAFGCLPDNNGSVRSPRILFYVERDLHLPFLEPLFDHISSRYRADLAFSAPPHQAPVLGRTGYGLDDGVLHRLRAKAKFYSNPEDFCPDITVIADACFYAVRNCGRTVNVGHGLISKGWFYTDSPVARRENLADVLCVPGEWHKQVMQKNVFSDIIVSGFIKSDAMLMCDESQREAFYAKYKIPSDAKLVLFAPTFNEELSAIPCVRERIAELAVDNAFVLIKLHTMVDRKWQIFYEKLARQAHGLVIIMEDDFAQAMACAQVLVSDVSSVFVEFMLLDKPIVLFNSPLQNSYQYYDANDIEYKLRDAALQVNTAEELKLAVKLSLADPGALSHIRAKYAGQLGCPQDGKCVQRAALAVMDLAGKLPAIPAEGPLFSIIIEGDCAPDTGEIKETIAEIESTSQGLRYEIIVGAGSVQSGLQYGGKVISAPLSRNALTTDVLNYASGDYLVWLKHDVMLPDNFLKWMWHFFRWHKGTGAVKALSYLDNFIDIINKIPDQHKPRSFDDASQYFMHALMGNECALTCVDDHVDCLMISRDAFQSAFDHTPPVAKYDGLHNMCLQLTLNKLSIWQALNVFVYPRSLHSELLSCKESHPTVTAQEAAAGDCLQYVQGLLTEALACRAEKKYKKAVEILEKAKARIAGDKE